MNGARFRTVACLIPLFVLPLAGCIGFKGPENMRRDLSRSANVDLDREFGITVRRSGMWMARWAMRQDDDLISLEGVRRVQVGIYQVEGSRRGEGPPGLPAVPQLPGWTEMVRVVDEGEVVYVLVDERAEQVRGMLVVVADDDEWVIVRLKGKLDGVVEDALRMALDSADRPDAYARTREERGLEPVPELSAALRDPAGS